LPYDNPFFIHGCFISKPVTASSIAPVSFISLRTVTSIISSFKLTGLFLLSSLLYLRSLSLWSAASHFPLTTRIASSVFASPFKLPAVIISIVTNVWVPVRSFSGSYHPCITFPVRLAIRSIVVAVKTAAIRIVVTVTVILRRSYGIIISSERRIIRPVTVIRSVAPVISYSSIVPVIIFISPETVVTSSVAEIAIVPVISFNLSGRKTPVIITTDIRTVNTYFIIPELCSARPV